MVGTASRTARVSIVRWNLKEAVSKTAVRRTASGYRRSHLGERANPLKARYHPEGENVDPTDICREGHANYPGKSVSLPRATDAVRCRDGLADCSRGRSSRSEPEG